MLMNAQIQIATDVESSVAVTCLEATNAIVPKGTMEMSEMATVIAFAIHHLYLNLSQVSI